MYDLASTNWIWVGSTSGDQVNVGGTLGNVLTTSSTGAIDSSITQSLLLSQTVHAATGKSTPITTDELLLVDTAASNILKKITWSQILTSVTMRAQQT